MVNTPLSTDHLWTRAEPCPHDAVVDVRSPAEFAEDHIPGAVNLPVLGDDERAAVGELYHQVGSFEARRAGAALVSANIGTHLRTFFADRPKTFRPFVYCWRGGERSASLATVLARIGWRVTVLKGGYKTYRGHVLRGLERLPDTLDLRIIAGATGSGKTKLLHHLRGAGGQVLDLEALANHRGSVLGAVSEQPSQKFFESLLLVELERVRTDAPVWVEAESHRIGDRYVPLPLWSRMRRSRGVELRMPPESRVAHLLGEYQSFQSDPALLKSILQRLAARHGRGVERWTQLIDAGDWHGLVASLLASHYDPGYEQSLLRHYPHVADRVDAADASDATLGALAARLVKEASLTPAGL